MEAAWTDMLAKVTFAWDSIKNYVETVINVVKDVINIAMALLKGDWQAAWDGVKQLVTDVWDGIRMQVADFLERVGEFHA
jgi:phage-related protein